jgi:hypothetical protein
LFFCISDCCYYYCFFVFNIIIIFNSSSDYIWFVEYLVGCCPLREYSLFFLGVVSFHWLLVCFVYCQYYLYAYVLALGNSYLKLNCFFFFFLSNTPHPVMPASYFHFSHHYRRLLSFILLLQLALMLLFFPPITTAAPPSPSPSPSPSPRFSLSGTNPHIEFGYNKTHPLIRLSLHPNINSTLQLTGNVAFTGKMVTFWF